MNSISQIILQLAREIEELNSHFDILEITRKLLNVHDFVNSLPDTEIGNDFSKLA